MSSVISDPIETLFIFLPLTYLHHLSIPQIMAAIFPLFSSLPQELRDQIWRDALPDENTIALYPYGRGCWRPQVEIPLVFVNRSARVIALDWVQKQDIEMRFCKDRQCHIFIRQFDLKRDAVYITPDKLYDRTESLDRIEEPDLFDKILSFVPALSHFAIPEALLEIKDNPLHEIFEDFMCLAVLFIIVNPQPDFADNDIKVQQQWELESIPGMAFFWNQNDRVFDLDGEYIGDEALYTRIEEAIQGLIPTLIQNRIHTFEIRPAFAIRR